MQTEIGAGRNEWISYMRECSSLYQARKEAERATTEGPRQGKKSEGRGNQTGEEGEGCLINLVGVGWLVGWLGVARVASHLGYVKRNALEQTLPHPRSGRKKASKHKSPV